MPGWWPKAAQYGGAALNAAIPTLASLPSKMRLNLAVVYQDGSAIAGGAFAVLGDVAYYVFGASNGAASDLQGG